MITSSRIWVIAGSLIIVVILILGGLLGVKPQLDIAAANDEQRAGVEALNVQQQAELMRLQSESEQVDEYRADVAELQKLVPAAANLDDFIAELGELQAANGVRIIAYSSLEEVLFAPTEQTSATLPASITSNNFVTIAIQISVEGPRENMMAFVEALQQGPRLFLATDLAVSDSDTIDISGYIYRLLDTPVVDPAAAVPEATTDTTEIAN